MPKGMFASDCLIQCGPNAQIHRLQKPFLIHQGQVMARAEKEQVKRNKEHMKGRQLARKGQM